MKTPKLDAEDALLFGGLAMLFAGLAWSFGGAAALAVVGAVLVVVSVGTAWLPRGKPGRGG